MLDWTWANVDDYRLYVAVKTNRKEVMATDNCRAKAGSECVFVSVFVSIVRLNIPKL